MAIGVDGHCFNNHSNELLHCVYMIWNGSFQNSLNLRITAVWDICHTAHQSFVTASALRRVSFWRWVPSKVGVQGKENLFDTCSSTTFELISYFCRRFRVLAAYTLLEPAYSPDPSTIGEPPFRPWSNYCRKFLREKDSTCKWNLHLVRWAAGGVLTRTDEETIL